MNDHVSACRHGQLSRVCRECELEAEIEALRAQLAEYRELVETLMEGNRSCIKLASNLLIAETKLADALSLLAHKGHDADCPAVICASCTLSRAAHDWEITPCKTFQPYPCSDACGYARVMGEG